MSEQNVVAALWPAVIAWGWGLFLRAKRRNVNRIASRRI